MVLGTAFVILALLARAAFPVTVAPTDYMYDEDYYEYDYANYDPCDYIDDLEIHKAHEGEEVTMRCSLADCIIPSSPFSWFKDDKAYPWTDRPTERISLRGPLHEMLEIDSVQIAGDNGTYRFSMTTLPPIILYPMDTSTSAYVEYRRLGQNVTFTCTAYLGVQQVIKQVYWLVNGTFINGKDRVKEGPHTEREDETGREFVNRTLVITDIQPEDYREYTCVAKNLFGNVTAQVQLTEGDDPNSSPVKEDLKEEMQQYRNGAAGGGAVLLMLCVLATVYYWKKLEIRLMIKDKFMPFEEGDTIEHMSDGDEDFQFHEQELHVTHFTMDIKLQQNARVLLSQEKDTIEHMSDGDEDFQFHEQELHVTHFTMDIKLQQNARVLLSQEKGQKEYDVFILYDIEQFEFVKNLLLPFLEKTCRCVVRIEHRDFTGGTELYDNYIEFIERSRRVLFVLSPNYVKNQWMKFASCVALDEMLREKARIVMIEYQPIKDQDDFERSVVADSIVSNSIVRFGFRRQRSTLSDGVADYNRENKRSTFSDDNAIIAEDDHEEVHVTTPCLHFIDETRVCNESSSMLEKETVL
uniref:Soluble interferon alpha/beta receptor OPG204 n=1 Tax=Branchiostoma floridae TaxID=7739 RepID=C3Y1I9_BRAFL|eukprot:XP_002609719.1 hypothetical protein BRAFLDRAFT_102466 [Branchiostoma floridae]